jgi:hypothetical protein
MAHYRPVLLAALWFHAKLEQESVKPEVLARLQPGGDSDLAIARSIHPGLWGAHNVTSAQPPGRSSQPPSHLNKNRRQISRKGSSPSSLAGSSGGPPSKPAPPVKLKFDSSSKGNPPTSSASARERSSRQGSADPSTKAAGKEQSRSPTPPTGERQRGPTRSYIDDPVENIPSAHVKLRPLHKEKIESSKFRRSKVNDDKGGDMCFS